MRKIAIIGDKTSALGFKALGVDVFIMGREETFKVWEKISFDDYAIILLTEQAYLELKNLVEEKMNQDLPVFLIIPSAAVQLGLAKSRLRKIIEKAVGVDILAKEGRT